MSDFWAIVDALFTGAWSMLTGIDFPGTQLSIAQILVGALVASLGLRVLFHLFGIGINAGDIRHAIHIERSGKP